MALQKAVKETPLRGQRDRAEQEELVITLSLPPIKAEAKG
jgi:hypothetical protein